jgi:hypothetical protein
MHQYEFFVLQNVCLSQQGLQTNAFNSNRISEFGNIPTYTVLCTFVSFTKTFAKSHRFECFVLRNIRHSKYSWLQKKNGKRKFA